MKNNISLAITAITLLFCNSTNAAIIYTDWQSVNTTTEIATGTLGAISVTMSGSDLYLGETSNGSTVFDFPSFSPSLPTSDFVGFRGAINPDIFNYTINFGGQVTNPLIHFSSLASDLIFSGVSINKISGDALFDVVGDTVSGVAADVAPQTDSNGTVQLIGTFNTLNFSASGTGFLVDGILLQIGVDENNISSVPVPAAAWLFGSGLIGLIGVSRRKRK